MTKPRVFSDEDRAQFRADIASVRSAGAYVSGQWSVSPRNRTAGGPMPSSVRLRDVSARGLEALPGVLAGADAKRRMLIALAESGIDEAVSASPRGRTTDDLRRDVDAVRSVRPEMRMTCPLVFAREGLVRAKEAGYDAIQAWMPPWGPASAIYEAVYQPAWEGLDWRDTGTPTDRASFLRRTTDLVGAARDVGLDVTVPMLMVSYLSDERLEETVDAVVGAGASEIALFDGPGGVGPEAYAELVSRVKALAPGVDVGIHAHNTFDLGVACVIAAVRAGADVVEVSINGYCGGPGNPDLAAVVAALEALYGVRTSVDPQRLTALARLGEEITGYPVAWNHAVTGRQAFTWGGLDFLNQELDIDPLLHNSIDPEWVGGRRPVLLTPESGPFTMWDKLVELGIEPTRRLTEATLGLVHDEMRRTNALVDDARVRELAANARATA